PLCPTRWTVRSPAIRAILRQYGIVLESRDQMSTSTSESASRAEGLHARLQQGNVVLGLRLALDVISELEMLNASLQKNTQKMEGMLSAVSLVKNSLKSKRNIEHFEGI
ncbi:zinc finger MYM-type protein 1-like, partial [Nothobranchius furzeri]